MSVAEELRRLRGESRLLQDHVSRLADREATTSGARGGADAAWSPTRLAMTSAVTGGAAALVATLGSGAWPVTLLAAAFGSALPVLVRAARARLW
ncbi:MAG: hypothetical protein KJ067_07950 [Vicinamibacteria bacterium]|nr:hypothetical protein [Vicinamibacteria bacterium]